MTRRTLHSAGVGAVIALGAAVVSVPLAGQSNRESVPPLFMTAFGDKPAPRYVTPTTPWGEPDLQGVWSSDDTEGIPMSRPAQFGNRLYLTDQEHAERTSRVQGRVKQAENEAASTSAVSILTNEFHNDFGRRAFPQTSLIVDPPDGHVPAYTVEGQRRPMPRGTFGNGPLDWTTDFSLYERCITRGIPGSSLRAIYGNGQRIVQAPGVVAVTYEMVHDTRVIYTDGRPHIGQAIRQYLGDSRARWERDELVVETTNLTDQTAIGGNGNGNRHSTQMKLTERFKRVADDIVQYQVTIDDPITYVRPFTIAYPLTPLDGGRLLPYDCHEGNLSMRQSLGAERAEDAALEADRARGIIRPRRPIQDGLATNGRAQEPGASPGGERDVGSGRVGAPGSGRGGDTEPR